MDLFNVENKKVSELKKMKMYNSVIVDKNRNIYADLYKKK